MQYNHLVSSKPESPPDMLRWSLFIVVLLAEWARSQSVSFGVCPEKKPVVDFDIEKVSQ